jgi:CRISPR/Cas system-associated exonuclease Cas4 (RecB family)
MLTSLTQGHLKQLETCPRKFQYGYREQLAVPVGPDVRASQEWGTRFHLLMQQRELGLSVDALLASDGELAEAVDRLVNAAPELFQHEDDGFRQSEHRRTLAFGDCLLTVVYDLLVMTPHQAQIVDWKTYLKPQGQKHLQQDWQTRLYLYVLTETTPYEPKDVSMTYWFVRAQDEASKEIRPTQVVISYSSKQHRQTERDLHRLTRQLAQLMATGEAFPKVDLSLGHCSHCAYALRCQRPSERYPAEWIHQLPAIAAIAEVPLLPVDTMTAKSDTTMQFRQEEH